MDETQKIKELIQKLEGLESRQNEFQNEIRLLRSEIESLRKSAIGFEIPAKYSTEQTEPLLVPEVKQGEPLTPYVPLPEQPARVIQRQPFVKKSDLKTSKSGSSSGMEEFIGKNVIPLIGVSILVLGIGFGVKYSIDNNLIQPITRIILGYLLGLGVLGTAIWLRKKYELFSGILLSGSMASFYFITFAAYNFYGLIPQAVAFIMMVLFTVFTVGAAIIYNRQVIAHVGLVGAYLVPVLLSDNSGRVAVLFTYMAIINAGILAISVVKYWKPLFYTALGLTWIIFGAWVADSYEQDLHFSLAITFNSIFFLIFYGTAIAYKILKKDKFNVSDVALILLNSFIFFGFGYGLLSGNPATENYLGLFALINAGIHLIVALVLNSNKLIDRSLVHFLSGLVLVFVTIAVPIQLDGNWVTLIWIAEAVVIFWLGRVRGIQLYEWLSYPLAVLALFSIFHDWDNYYTLHYSQEMGDWYKSFLNVQFMVTLMVSLGFGLMAWWNFRNVPEDGDKRLNIRPILNIALPVAAILVLFAGTEIEIQGYWNKLTQLFERSSNGDNFDQNWQIMEGYDAYSSLWMTYFMIGFFTLLALSAKLIIKSRPFGGFMVAANLVALFIFVALGLFQLSVLRESYLGLVEIPYTSGRGMLIGIRYIGYIFVAISLISSSWVIFWVDPDKFKRIFDLAMHALLVIILSSELIHWMDMRGSDKGDKIAMTVIWGAYALLLIVLGIWQKRQELRIMAMVLTALTIGKLFLYDLSDASTLAKTITFVIFGILLLIVAFLYNKYKDVILGDEKKEEPKTPDPDA